MAENKYQTEKIVINAGPTFASAMSFVVFGALLGIGATYYLTRQGEQSAQAEFDDSLRATERGAESLKSRLGGLSSRVKTLAGRAKDAAQSFNENVRPALQEAVAEGKAAARATSAELAADLHADLHADSQAAKNVKKPFDDLTTEEA